MVFWVGNDRLFAAPGGVGKISDIHRLWLPRGGLESRSRAGVVCSIVETLRIVPGMGIRKQYPVEQNTIVDQQAWRNSRLVECSGGSMHQGQVLKCEKKRCKGNITAYARKKTRSDPKRSREKDSRVG